MTVRRSARYPRAFDAAQPERAERRRRWTDWPGRPERRAQRQERWQEMRTGARERRWAGRGRELLRRFRQPIIGLTLAGAAGPLAKVTRRPKVRQPPEHVAHATPEPLAPTAATPATGTTPTLDEQIAARIEEGENARLRENTIQGAMVRYGIAHDLASDIFDAAVAEGIEPDLAYGLVRTESAFKPRAVSSVGARGLTQVMPSTARWLRPGTTVEDLFDRRTNLHLGFSYLRDLIGKYRGNYRLALLAYNRGPGTVDRVLRRGGNPDNGYADKVLSG